ncbi:MAG: hypothetical protein JOZ29_13735 [Deltaproteobacteria bacterium]|nr:hypothetical protein [Deltaproteobacteria bacterium]
MTRGSDDSRSVASFRTARLVTLAEHSVGETEMIVSERILGMGGYHPTVQFHGVGIVLDAQEVVGSSVADFILAHDTGGGSRAGEAMSAAIRTSLAISESRRTASVDLLLCIKAEPPWEQTIVAYVAWRSTGASLVATSRDCLGQYTVRYLSGQPFRTES